MKTICHIGMERSGNHAIMQWIARRYRPYVVTQRVIPQVGKCKAATALNCSDKMGKHERESALFYDLVLNGDINKLDRDYDQVFIVLRDPYNWLASLVSSFYDFNITTCNYRFFVSTWIAHANSAMSGATWINYNKWIDDEHKLWYANSLGLPKVKHDDTPSNLGRGSSYGKDADQNYTERYINTLGQTDESVIYKHILRQYPELVFYGRQLFGMATPPELSELFADLVNTKRAALSKVDRAIS